MRIAFIEPVGGHGGQDQYDAGLCQALIDRGVQVAYYTCDETSLPPASAISLKRFFRGIYGRDPAVLRGVRYIIGIVRTVIDARLRSTDICHFYYFKMGWLELLTVASARLLGMRVLVTANDIDPFESSLAGPLSEALLYGLAHGVVVHNEASRRALTQRVPRVAGRIEVVPHGNYLHIIGSIPGKQESRETLGLPASAPVVLFFGQIKEVKGVEVLLRSMPEVLAHHPTAVLVIAGKVWKTDFDRYNALIGELGMAGHCVLHIHYIPNDRMGAYFAAADVVVLPYKKIFFSGVLFLAMSYGKSVIASDLDPMREVIEHGRNGYLFRSGDSASLAAMIVRSLSNRPESAAAGAAARADMEKTYGWHRVGALMHAVYEKVNAIHG